MVQTPSKIFLSLQRGKTETTYCRSLHTFNFDDYFDENKQIFMPLLALNDNTLAAGKSISRILKKSIDVFILPLVGGIEYRILKQNDFLEAGQILHFSATKDAIYEIINPYESELINYLEIWVEQKIPTNKVLKNNINTEKQNELLCIFEGKSSIYFGKYDGRAEGIYHFKKPTNKLFTFVIDGAFEVDNKLMESRDGLALWNVEKIEFEALSNNAMLLLLEMEE